MRPRDEQIRALANTAAYQAQEIERLNGRLAVARAALERIVAPVVQSSDFDIAAGCRTIAREALAALEAAP